MYSKYYHRENISGPLGIIYIDTFAGLTMSALHITTRAERVGRHFSDSHVSARLDATSLFYYIDDWFVRIYNYAYAIEIIVMHY